MIIDFEQMVEALRRFGIQCMGCGHLFSELEHWESHQAYGGGCDGRDLSRTDCGDWYQDRLRRGVNG